MKTTIDFPDPLFRRAKATAAVQGITLKTFITRAVEKQLASTPGSSVREFLEDLPRVDDETLEIIRLRIEESDRDDLMLQEKADRLRS